MDVSILFAVLHDGSFAKHSLHAQIKRDVENFQITFRPDSGQKAEVVLNVLKDIEYQN